MHREDITSLSTPLLSRPDLVSNTNACSNIESTTVNVGTVGCNVQHARDEANIFTGLPNHCVNFNSNESMSSIPHMPSNTDHDIIFEFGGPVGVTFMMGGFPLLMYYFWICIEYYNGVLVAPANWDDLQPFLFRMIEHVAMGAAPSWWAFTVYGMLVAFQAVLAVTMPGPVVKGLPIPSLGNRQLEYLCNGLSSFYVTIATSVILHTTGIFPLESIIDRIGELMTISIIFGFAITLITYTVTIMKKKQFRMSGYFMYDLFMGAVLNPRLGPLDLKMFSEIRIPWVVLFYISVSALMKEYQMKGVPFTYCYAALYLVKTEAGRNLHIPITLIIILFAVLFVAYYIWDTANSQKNRFRMSIAGTYIPRATFPQLPWSTLENPKYITTERGSPLLTSGWWGMARKIHYTADLAMALTWGLATGFSSVIPYFYFFFFLIVMIHRTIRDMERCSKKYGADWDEYCRIVPYIFIPFVF
ncbi:hypothetical protein BDEG_26773 [Batrachochytrium dendrobatidis JEL423]|uniref:Delta(24(24(1)))-sterol reductase n=1 Tax=Batrachochytrium dendrobatidis (strain JEL423) TaxID=403673 RepID=A0A177WVB3_BATDL|nr:hypothetical protein BDEG_26773 [Batrachochytrium dendrobatidis JEL423]